MGSEEEDSVEQAAAARRERLRALRAAQQLLETPDDNDSSSATAPKVDNNDIVEEDANGADDNQENSFNLKFRNYLPHDDKLQEGKLAPPVLPKFEDPAATTPPPQDKEEDPFLNIAPKKPNWDLRRDVQKKLDKLEKRTQKAMFQLMEQQERERALAEDGRNGAED